MGRRSQGCTSDPAHLCFRPAALRRPAGSQSRSPRPGLLSASPGCWLPVLSRLGTNFCHGGRATATPIGCHPEWLESHGLRMQQGPVDAEGRRRKVPAFGLENGDCGGLCSACQMRASDPMSYVSLQIAQGCLDLQKPISKPCSLSQYTSLQHSAALTSTVSESSAGKQAQSPLTSSWADRAKPTNTSGIIANCGHTGSSTPD